MENIAIFPNIIILFSEIKKISEFKQLIKMFKYY